MNRSFTKLSLLAPLVIATSAHALPMDWHGTFGVDSTMISGYRLVDNKTDNQTGAGSQEVMSATGSKQSASWQSYIFRLNPEIIINDSATFKGEFTTGYGAGGNLGDDPQTNNPNNSNRLGDALYYYNQAGGKNVTLSKAYLEFYSDTATYQLGRHTYNWGLGALYSDGGNSWDRFSYSRDGVTMKVKLGNFHVTPFWSKIANTQSLARATYAKEYGIGLLYDNPEKDITFGINYTVKTNSNLNTTYTTQTEDGTTTKNLGKSDVKVTDIYFKKIFGSFDVAVEVPLLDGEIGNANAAATPTKLSAKSVILESNYRHNDAWTFGLDAGRVDGNDSNPGQFDALYLNPNYKVANILFHYNMMAVQDTNQSVYDAYLTNALYLKLRAEYKTEKWALDGAVIHAKANETATAGAVAYNHTKHQYFNAVATQNDSLGTEIDFGATYKWNSEISIGTKLGYLITGDYYAFNNTATPNKTKNALLLQVNAGVKF